ncbi:hypothetical protein FRC10_007699 [Ceratobasidium sp. 414]|nr:hypothetical protein FRC10_007699 [Ceratobasidium sp. 414]
MKRKRTAPKPLPDPDDAVFIVPVVEPEKPEPEPEDPAVAEWNTFAQDHYELVEQLPLSLHRSFSLIRELDDLVQDTTARILPATRAYIALRESMLLNPKQPPQHAPSGLDLLAHVSAAVEPPAPSIVPPLPGQEPEPPTNPVPNLALTPLPAPVDNVVHMDEDVPAPEAPAAAVDPGPNSSGPSADPAQPPANLAPAHPALIQPVPTAPPLPSDSRALLTLIATLASDAVRASNEKVGIANTVYQTVDNHLRALDALIAQHKATLPHQPSPDPSPPPLQHSPTPHLPSSPTPASPTKARIRRRTRATEDKEAPGDEADGEGEDEPQSIPPLRITRTNGTTPTTIRIRNRSVSKPKPKDQADEVGGSPSRKGRSTSMTKGTSNSGSSKGNSGSSRGAQKPPPNASNAQSKGNGNSSAAPKTPSARRVKPPPRGRRTVGGEGEADEQPDERRYCYCNEVSFGEVGISYDLGWESVLTIAIWHR